MERLATDPSSMFRGSFPGWGAFLGTGKPLQTKRSPEEWVPIAVALAENHGGILPCVKWINKNGYSGLAKSMSKHPELFAHIEQGKPHGHHKTLEQWVPVAEDMARKNGGVLQSVAWLRKNNCNGLVKAMRGRPELFSHVKQEKPQGHFKSPEQWAPVADALAAKHGGVLPCGEWLERNGHGGLASAIRKRPELFAHIEQERRNHGRHIIGYRGSGQAAESQVA